MGWMSDEEGVKEQGWLGVEGLELVSTDQVPISHFLCPEISGLCVSALYHVAESVITTGSFVNNLEPSKARTQRE